MTLRGYKTLFEIINGRLCSFGSFEDGWGEVGGRDRKRFQIWFIVSRFWDFIRFGWWVSWLFKIF